MMYDVGPLNRMSDAEARAALLRCCGSTRWAEQMSARRPFTDEAQLFAAAHEIELGLTRTDWLEAFAAHPKIGDLDSLRSKFAPTVAWSAQEQGTLSSAAEHTIQALAAGNQAYEAKFGHIFIICATGKTADEMLAFLRTRLHNNPADEFFIAAAEQEKITRLRLEKWLQASQPMSPITTHVLDTAAGRPAAGVAVLLEQQGASDTWIERGRGVTNADGRLAELLPTSTTLAAGIYRLRFLTGPYFAARGITGFFPEIPVQFQVNEPSGHYHVPLLLSPFGYSTYRGS